MQVNAPAPATVIVVDYDITLVSGRELPGFTLRPDLGDVVETLVKCLRFKFAKTAHTVEIARNQIAVLSRREREMVLPEPKIDMKAVTLGG